MLPPQTHEQVKFDPDHQQVERFVNAIFRHADPRGLVSSRSFVLENGKDKPFNHHGVPLSGGLEFLVTDALDYAYRAANHPLPVVFCPPLCTFSNKERARESDLFEGLALSVECDQHPQAALFELEKIIGQPTIIVRSGGKWCDPNTNQVYDKLHLHYRLKVPARGKDQLAKLKLGRKLATKLVGGDASNDSIVHPIRWPGSWHRKGTPILCENDEIHPDIEIDLDTALEALVAATPQEQQKTNGKAHENPFSAYGAQHGAGGGGADWGAEFQGVISGTDYHGALARLAMKMLKAGIPDAVAANMLRGLMDQSTGPHDERWQARRDDIPRAVSTAREKLDSQNPPPTSPYVRCYWEPSNEPPILWLIKKLLPEVGIGRISGQWGTYKTFIALELAGAIMTGGTFLGRDVKRAGGVLFIAAEGHSQLRIRVGLLGQTGPCQRDRRDTP